MNFEAVIKILLEQFGKQKVRCAIIGGFALHAAGFSRATNDIDFLAHQEDVLKIKEILSNRGYDLGHESEDVLNFWGKLKELGGVDFIIAHRKYALSMLERAKPYEIIPGTVVPVVIPEDIIGLKLQAIANDSKRKDQDMADIQWLIKAKHKNMKMDIVKEYFDVFNQGSDLQQILKEVDSA